jgi:hypothetical protein
MNVLASQRCHAECLGLEAASRYRTRLREQVASASAIDDLASHNESASIRVEQGLAEIQTPRPSAFDRGWLASVQVYQKIYGLE